MCILYSIVRFETGIFRKIRNGVIIFYLTLFFYLRTGKGGGRSGRSDSEESSDSMSSNEVTPTFSRLKRAKDGGDDFVTYFLRFA